MTINNNSFKNLLENLPPIEAALEWDGKEGRADIDDYEISLYGYLLFISFHVYASRTYNDGDHLTPSSFIIDNFTAHTHTIIIFTEDNLDEITLYTEQTSRLIKKIESLISID